MLNLDKKDKNCPLAKLETFSRGFGPYLHAYQHQDFF